MPSTPPPSVPPPRPRKPALKKCDPARYVELCTTAQFFHRFCRRRGISQRDLAAFLGIDPKLVHEVLHAEDPIHLHVLRRFPRRARADLLVEFLALPDVDPDITPEQADVLLAAHG